MLYKLNEREALERGKEREKRFFRAMTSANAALPEWLYGFRKGSKFDDHNGVDAFAKTDVGDIPIQIKSSQAGLAKHVKRYGLRHVIIVVSHQMLDVLLRYTVIQKLEQRRATILRYQSKPTEGPL